MAKREVTENLLKAMIGIKYESGVEPSKIQAILNFFDSPSQKHKPNWREMCLAQLTALTPSEKVPEARSLPASEIWPSRIFDEGYAQEFGTYMPTEHSALIDGISPNFAASPVEIQTPAGEGLGAAEGDSIARERQLNLEATIGSPHADPVVFNVKKMELEPARRAVPYISKSSQADVSKGAGVSVATTSEGVMGDATMWERLTPGELDRAVEEVARRRQETLARHARELEELDADAIQIAALKEAINAFAQKFKSPSDNGEKSNRTQVS